MPLPPDFFGVDPGTPRRRQDSKETRPEVAQVPSPFNDGDMLGHFVLEKLLGSGSSGYVYRAHDTQTDRDTAVKILRPGDPSSLLLNRYGFRRMMPIEHPNLMKVDRIYQIDGYTCLTMEEVSGVTLAYKLQELSALPLDQAFEALTVLLRDYATGLAVMHAHGYVHRDIKPHNLMVDKRGRGKIIDFGLVDQFEIEELSFDTEGGSWLGTPRYFAPEVIWSQRYLPSSDLYALGLVFSEAIRVISDATGSLGEATNNDTPDDASEALAGLPACVPESLREACELMLERYPSDRPTAMRMARVGLPSNVAIDWPTEAPLVGRDDELDVIERWVDDIFAGNVSRINITGPSGMGKSRLIQDVVQYIESKNWGQVFLGRCRAREDAPLQAFSQICDLIAYRYRRTDREKIELDPVSTQVMCQAFPVMATVIQPRDHQAMKPITPIKRDAKKKMPPSRHEALEAAVALCDQLRSIGPLFLIIDDTQWADRDSLNVLDRLSNAAADTGLGIITLSRSEVDRQLIPADVELPLEKLSIDDGMAVLRASVSPQVLKIDDETLRALSQTTDGSPFRLQEVAKEMASSGRLATESQRDEFLDGDEFNIDRLWQRRAEGMSDHAKALLPLVAAGGRVSTEQLGELSGLGVSVDAAISELAHTRLITDEATGGECISIFHDRVADSLIAGLETSDQQQAHLAWATLLIENDQPSEAARIAGHLFSADRPRQAVHFAIKAAEVANLVMAKTAAGRWYALAAEHTEGTEKLDLTRRAADCYQEADQPTQAAVCFRQMCSDEFSTLVNQDQRSHYQQTAVAMDIRSGRFADAREQLQVLSKELRLPQPRSPFFSRLYLVGYIAQLLWQRRSVSSPGGAKYFQECYGIGDIVIAEEDLTQQDRFHRQRLNMCYQLTRPLTMFDSLIATQLNVVAAGLVKRYGTENQRTHVASGETVFDCYQRGKRRNDAEMRLVELNRAIASSCSLRSRADLWSSRVYNHLMSCRWDQIKEPLALALQAYRNLESSHRLEIAHTQWIGLWADWNLGRWNHLASDSEEMMADAVQRNDLFEQMAASGGFGAGAWLIRDQPDDLERVQTDYQAAKLVSHQIEIFSVFDWMSKIQRHWYHGDCEQAWSVYRSIEGVAGAVPFKHLQFVRVIIRSFGTLAALHQLYSENSQRWVPVARRRIKRLRREKIPFTNVLADFHEGLLAAWMDKSLGKRGARDSALTLLRSAAEGASEQHLRPLELAAKDTIAKINGDSDTQRLLERMKQRGVVAPVKLARLYTPDLNSIN